MVLGQTQEGNEVVIAYSGRKLNQGERNYSAMEREALEVVEGIKKFPTYLYGCHFVVHTDHLSLKWLQYEHKGANRAPCQMVAPATTVRF